MKVLLNSPGYMYDVHSLVKAFYQNEDIEVTECSGDDFLCEEGITVHVSSGDIPKDTKVTGNITCTYNSGDLHKEYSSVYADEDRAEVKTLLKLVLYNLLNDVTGITLPWGTLTGIRPTKIPMKMINEGSSDADIYDYMKTKYQCSDEKIKLSTKIAHLENSIIKSADMDGYSLYIGIPFCPTTCLYCSFTSYPIATWGKYTTDYLNAVKKEIDFTAEQFAGKSPDSIYIGGGTPTTLSADELTELITYVREHIDMSRVKELTVEAGRPDSITADKLKALKKMGTTRLSINPQTMNDKTLKVIGRQHTADMIVKAFEMARAEGFDNINTDLILGLPGENESDVQYTFDKIKELSPDSITVHSMAIKRAANMHRFLEEHQEYKSINTPQMMEIAEKCALDLGLDAYYLYRQKNMSGNFENVGYASSGKYGLYNILIMEEVQTIIACGAGTVTKRVYGDGRIERCDNVKDVALYIDKIDEMIERKRNLFAD